MPSVFDPFAGGGAIPLETARLGCRSYGNDINPVAHIIEKGSVEFPQKYGKPIRYTEEEFSSYLRKRRYRYIHYQRYFYLQRHYKYSQQTSFLMWNTMPNNCWL